MSSFRSLSRGDPGGYDPQLPREGGPMLLAIRWSQAFGDLAKARSHASGDLQPGSIEATNRVPARSTS